MSRKSAAIAALIQPFEGNELDARYLCYFACFNRQRYYEAHDVLEELWLAQKAGANCAFYQGLIQLAGAFCHLQKNRLRPAAALFKLAEAKLNPYPPMHEQLDLSELVNRIRIWREELEAGGYSHNPLQAGLPPTLKPTLVTSV